MSETIVFDAITEELANVRAGSPSFNNWRPRWASDYIPSSDDRDKHWPVYVFAGENEDGKSVFVRLCLLERAQKLRIITSVLGSANETSEESRCIVQYSDQDLQQIARQVLYVTRKADQIGVDRDGCLGGLADVPRSQAHSG